MPYDPNFIPGESVPLPVPGSAILNTIFGQDWVHHSRHSLLFNIDRGFAFVAAHNIDGATLPASQHTSRNFRFDPLVQPNNLQVDKNQGYRESDDGAFGPNPWDQGHLARRKSLSWGNIADAISAERESDFWTNIVPQHNNLHSSAWGPVEDWVLERVEEGAQRACVFTGPVFTNDDPVHQNNVNEQPIQIPAGFWKVITVKLEGSMRSAGFLIWQRDYDSALPVSFSPVLEQVRLTTIEVLTGLSFPTLRGFDPLLFNTDGQARMLSASVARQALRDRLLSQAGIPAQGAVLSRVDEVLVTRATMPGTAAITHQRDIVL